MSQLAQYYAGNRGLDSGVVHRYTIIHSFVNGGTTEWRSASSKDRRAPPAEMLITDLEQLKAVSDPLRIQLLELMGEAPVRGWTAKELAERLATKQTKLYHHINLLEERGFISVAETRMVSGIQEKRYRVNALSFRVDRNLFTRRPGPGSLCARARRDLREGAQRDHGRPALRADRPR